MSSECKWLSYHLSTVTVVLGGLLYKMHILSNEVLVSQAACGLFLEHLITQEIEEEAYDEMKMLYFKLD